MKPTHLLTALSVLCPALAWSSPTHNVMSNRGLYVSEPGAASQNITSADMTFVWTEGTTNAFGLAKAWVATGDAYEFQLASVTAPTTATSIQGLWNISKNGTLLCASCAGQVYGFSGSFKFYTVDSGYHFSGFITSRYDY
ncbi:hypothetical protein CYFUS_008345 [Cystobacter fuscus]|uniref:Uncharacterized protein n=1 Tax=Cystobacter fuscus TaxID=43 RepID=A0A250JI88_9BACT|nr:hypothetical protein [Cystobacter fuscus]ATB42866.1 hypothetical protein CYFUS_008345 [Cystobacter fuscus]